MKMHLSETHEFSKHIMILVGILWICLFDTRVSWGVEVASDIMSRVVIEEFQRNRETLNCGAIVWYRNVMENGFVQGRQLDREGSYALWWNKEKIATKYLEDKITMQNGEWVKRKHGEVKAFNGKDFRQILNVESPKDIAISLKPDFRRYENYLEIIGWSGKMPQDKDILGYIEADHVDVSWSTVKKNNDTLAKLLAKNKKDGAYLIHYYNLDKGGNLVCEEFYNENGQLYLKKEVELELIENVTWFPVAVNICSIAPDQNNKITLRNHFAVDLKNSSFNKPSDIPEAIFDIEITNEMEISDYRGGVRINYDRDVSPLATEALDELVQDFLGEDKEGVSSETGEITAQKKRDNLKLSESANQNNVADEPWPVDYTVVNRRRIIQWVFIGVGMAVLVIGLWRIWRATRVNHS